VPALIDELFRVQEGNCFLCGKPMRHFTKEHVYPRRTSGYRMINNIVLAHGPCNHKRGSIAPTEDQISRAAAIYQTLGLQPFVYLPSIREKKKLRRLLPRIITDCHGPEWAESK
jgi:hypothetical protein